MSTPKKRGRPRTFQREQTVARAMEAYWREGLHGLSVNEICRRTGLSKPSLYREFGGEDGLFDAVLERYGATVIAPMGEGIDPSRSFVENIERLLDVVTSSERLHRGCLFVKMRDTLERLGPQTRARVDGMIGAVLASYTSLFLRAIEQGEVRNDVAPQLAAEYIDSQISLALRQIAVGREPADVRALSRLAFEALLVIKGRF